MSKYFGYRCQTCDEESPRWFNWGQDILRNALPLASHFKAIVESELVKEWDCEIKIMGVYDYPSPPEFLANHFEHDVIIVDEYSEVYA